MEKGRRRFKGWTRGAKDRTGDGVGAGRDGVFEGWTESRFAFISRS